MIVCTLAVAPVARTLKGSAGSPLLTTLFLGIALAATAVPVLAVILRQLGVADERIPLLAMRIAVITDGIGWVLLTLLVVTVNSHSRPSVGLAGLGAAGVVVVVVAIPRVTRNFDGDRGDRGALVLLMFVCAVIGGVSAHLVGAHPAIGAAIAGFTFPPVGHRGAAHRALSAFADAVLPVFFVCTALAAPFQALSGLQGWANIGGLGLLVLAAFMSKLFAGTVTGFVLGWPRREGVALGILLNCRGVTEIAIASVGFQSGVINTFGFAALIIVAVLTTSTTGPLYRWAMLRENVKAQRRERVPESTEYPIPSAFQNERT